MEDNDRLAENGADYDVGYGKPPAETRFSKGQSGNPRGRPKGSRNIATIFHEVTQELIHVKENGKGRTVTKLEASMIQLMNKAASGDLKATKEILQWNRIFEEAVAKEAPENPDKEKDAAVMRRLLQRLQASSGASQESATEPTEEAQ